MARRILSPPSQTETFRSQIRQLETELFLARETILSLIPSRLRDALKEMSRAADWASLHAEMDACIDRVVALAEVRPGREMGDIKDRAYCPLCGDGSQTPGLEGYGYPEGLSRHLAGSHRANQCRVFEAAYQLARGSVEYRQERERSRQ